AQAELAQEAGRREERLLGDDPRSRELRVERRLEVGAEGAVPVGADGTGQEKPVVDRDVLLEVGAERPRLGARLVPAHVGARGDRARARGQDLAPRAVAVEDMALELDADRRPAVDRGRERTPGRDGAVEGVDREVRAVVDLEAEVIAAGDRALPEAAELRPSAADDGHPEERAGVQPI